MMPEPLRDWWLREDRGLWNVMLGDYVYAGPFEAEAEAIKHAKEEERLGYLKRSTGG